MATMVGLLKQTNEIVDTVFDRNNSAEDQRREEYVAAVKVQSWFRATRIRSYLSFLNSSALCIQRRWRGFVGRRRYREILKQQVFIMKLNHYNALTTKIQKVWRGYYVRKYVFNYHSRKRYLEGLKVKNEIVRNELAEYAEQVEQQQQWQKEEEQRKRLEHYARKHHYLVSTEVMPGIFNSPFQPYPEEMEFHLRHARPLEQEKTAKKGQPFDPSWKQYETSKHFVPLPPIEKKPQGPFRDPRLVTKQRYKAFQPSLRVATSYTSVEEAREKMKQEEWVTRLNDDIFLPFTKRSVPYDKLLHTTSGYGHLPYGTKYFRHEYPDKFVMQNVGNGEHRDRLNERMNKIKYKASEVDNIARTRIKAI